jgi:hypothetical protein
VTGGNPGLLLTSVRHVQRCSSLALKLSNYFMLSVSPDVDREGNRASCTFVIRYWR